MEAARKEFGKDVVVIASDASVAAAQRAVADLVREAFGGLDVLFVNAGISELRPIEKWDEAGFDRSMSINLKGPFFLIQALLPVFANPASIVLNGSVNAHVGMANTTVFTARPRRGSFPLARTLSGELIGQGIRANVVSAGPVSAVREAGDV